MGLKATVQIKVPFHDVDVMRVVWHGHYYKYFEIARTELFKALDLDCLVLEKLGLALPVVESKVEYRKPISYDQDINVEASLEQPEVPELVVNYQITDHGGKVYTRAMTRQVYLDIKNRQAIFEIPPPVRQRLAQGLNQ